MGRNAVFTLASCCLLLLSVAASTPLAAALGGVPETPVPGRSWPQAWVLLSNDDMGVDDFSDYYASIDDHRTAAVLTGLRIDRWLILADYAILTDRSADTRVDEMTLSLGRLLSTGDELGLSDNDSLESAVGIAWRSYGDLNGEQVQNKWHEVWGIDEVHADYESGGDLFIAWASSEWTWLAPIGASNWAAGVSMHGRGLVTHEGEAKTSFGSMLVLQHPKLDAWVGLRSEFRHGEAPSITKEAVREAEDGTWLSYGIAPGRRLVITGGYNVDTEESFGTVGVVWPSRR